ncbi:hypothetical protein K3495_g6357 [Podosphaera aphanis]|nr:hypothetical protein K3495_g6357 [Podosphaera aphanis]
MKFLHLPVSKARKPKFELSLRVYDLNNVPLVTGTSFVKWHLPSSTAAEHSGRTERALIKEHKVVWDYIRIIPLRLSIDRNNHLQDCLISFEVIQDCSTAEKANKIILGKVDLNLAEYVDEVDAPSEIEKGALRRYLMQESKINSTLKIGISMRHIDGERNYTAPPLKMAMVFGGITGIVSGEQDRKDDVGRIPTISKSQDSGEIQDMYRRTLAASWASHDEELSADQCIEDIFNGGNGWKHEIFPKREIAAEENSSDDNRLSLYSQQTKPSSNLSLKSQDMALSTTPSSSLAHKSNGSQETLSPYAVIQEKPLHLASKWQFDSTASEFDEFSAGEDLIAWKVQERTSAASL